jgi:ethanolamine ammonia-lyase small subunit
MVESLKDNTIMMKKLDMVVSNGLMAIGMKDSMTKVSELALESTLGKTEKFMREATVIIRETVSEHTITETVESIGEDGSMIINQDMECILSQMVEFSKEHT